MKDYLIMGYALGKKRLQEKSRQLSELKQTIKVLSNVIGSKALNSDKATGLLRIVTDYAYALIFWINTIKGFRNWLDYTKGYISCYIPISDNCGKKSRRQVWRQRLIRKREDE